MNVREAWAAMVDADQTYLHARARWRELGADQSIPWDDQRVADATAQLTAAGEASDAAHEDFEDALERATWRGERFRDVA